jgi:hypothetical protein
MLVVLGVIVALGVGSGAAASTPGTSLSITAWSVGGRTMQTYTLTCAPAAVRGAAVGRLRTLDACVALREIGDRIYQPALSRHLSGCNYIQAPPRATIAGIRNGRRVRTAFAMGGCERLLVPPRLLSRVVVWPVSTR